MSTYVQLWVNHDEICAKQEVDGVARSCNDASFSWRLGSDFYRRTAWTRPAALRSLRLLSRENPFKTFQPFNRCTQFKSLQRTEAVPAVPNAKVGRLVPVVLVVAPWRLCERNDFFVSFARKESRRHFHVSRILET